MLTVNKYLQKLTDTIKHALLIADKRKIQCKVFANINWGTSVNIRLQNIDTLEVNNNTNFSITVYKNHRQGSANITELDYYAIEKAIDQAISATEFTQSDPYTGLPDPNLIAKKFIDLDLCHPYPISIEHAIKTAKKCELAALNYHQDIVNSDGVIFNYYNNIIAIGNSHDFIAAYPETNYSLSCTMIAESHGDMQRNSDFTISRNFKELIHPEIVGNNAAIYAHNKLGARKINTCKTKVLFIPEIAARLFRYLIAAISGSNIGNKCSFLLEHLNRQIFPSFIDIIDHPFIMRGFKSCCFDTDGIATQKKAIITNGVLNTYLLSNYFANKLKLMPTGHANGIHNLFINHKGLNFYNQTALLPTTKAITNPEIREQRADLIQQMGNGLIVTETIGQGINLVTGDYSQGAFGFLVENGKIAYPVQEITIAGNLMDMFANIINVGTDYDYRNNIITGSVLIDNIIVAGN